MNSDPAATKGPVVVIGFGRSGTSLVTRVLSLLGVDLGAEEDLLPASETDNAAGYWEPRWMIELNDEILALLGGPWWEPLSADPDWPRRPELEPLRQRARDLLEAKYGGRELWGFKDPRVSYTLPFWRELLPAGTSYVVCLRNPVDAVASMQRRPEPTLPVQRWGELWLEYTARALHETAGDRRALVFYEDFFRDGDAEIARLGEFVGLGGADRVERAAEAVRSDLRHHSTSYPELAADPGVPAEARTLFLALRAAEDLRRSGADDARLSQALQRVAPDLWWVNRQAALAAGRQEDWARQSRENDERHAAARRELESLRRTVAELEQRAQGAETWAHQEAAARASVEESASWRLTAPLRRAAQSARARRR